MVTRFLKAQKGNHLVNVERPDKTGSSTFFYRADHWPCLTKSVDSDGVGTCNSADTDDYNAAVLDAVDLSPLILV